MPFSLYMAPQSKADIKLFFALSFSCLNGCVSLWARVCSKYASLTFCKIPFMYVEFSGEKNELKMSWECRSVMEHLCSTCLSLDCIPSIHNTHTHTSYITGTTRQSGQLWGLSLSMWIIFSEKQFFFFFSFSYQRELASQNANIL